MDTYTTEGASSSQSISTASTGLSGTQGQSQWQYQYTTDNTYFTNMTYDSTSTQWDGSEPGCLIGPNWQSSGGNVCESARTWVAQKAALVTISANGSLSVPASCTGGASIQVRHNGAPIWPTSGWFTIPAGGSAAFPALEINVSAGDNLQFVEERASCQVTWDPVVSFSTGSVVHQATSYTYDGYGRVITTQVSSDDAGSPGSPSMITTHTLYVWNDAVTATATSATGTYLINFPASTYTVDANGKRANCTYTSYDGLSDEIGAKSNFTGRGLVTETDACTTLNATTCGYQASLGFSGTQGKNQWRYQYSNDGEQTFQDMTYDSQNGIWRGNMAWCQIWANGQHPNAGSFTMPGGCASVRTWVAPSAGSVTISANGPISVAAPCVNAFDVLIQVLKNGTQIWPTSGWQAISHGSSIIFPTLTTSVAAGDQIHFVEHAGKFDNCDSTTWDPQVGIGAAIANFLALSRQAAHQQSSPSSASQETGQSPYSSL